MHSCSTQHRRGFTLVEMLVTIALVVVLMLAVTQIFSIASRTISGGQALGSSTRDARSAQAVFARDFASVAADGACFNIYMNRIATYRDREDLETDRGDTNPLSIDLDGDGTEETVVSALAYNLRNHRSDSILFFARDRFARQTGNNGVLVADMTSNEAAIFYHHLHLADNSGVPTNNTVPGAGDPNSNPNNLYASQFILGRYAMLLSEPVRQVATDPNSPLVILDKPNGTTPGTSQTYIESTDGPTSTSATPSMSPLGRASQAKGTNEKIYTSRFDLAGTTIDLYRAKLEHYIGSSANNTNKWWNEIMGGATRFQASVYAARPLTSAAAAQQVPIFVPACSQFMVEFAGDFITQNPDGSINTTNTVTLGIEADGVIDFVPTTRQIRWYGLPRDTTGDGVIRGEDGDVVPVCDVTRRAMGFEVQWPTSGATSPGTSMPALNKDYYTQVTLPPNPGYAVAWPPIPADASLVNNVNEHWKFHRPKMIRITLGIDRPEGQMPDGPSFEYVFKVGQ